MLNGVRRRLVKSSLGKQDFERVYSLLDCSATLSDCGRLCGKTCCREYEPGVGMYLLPGEETMFTGKEPWLRWSYRSAKRHGFPETWRGLVAFAMCRGMCPREKRPIQCRTFPLMPYLDRAGNLSVRPDTLTGSLICPLVRESASYPLNPDFEERAMRAWSILIKDPLIRADAEQQSRKLDEDEKSAWRHLLG